MKKTIILILMLAVMSVGVSFGQTFSSKYRGLEMINVDGGTFSMGCTADQQYSIEYYNNDGVSTTEVDCPDDEKPVHRVTVSSFQIAKYEVTVGLWYEVYGLEGKHNYLLSSFIEYLDNIKTKTKIPYKLPINAKLNEPIADDTQEAIRNYIKEVNSIGGYSYKIPEFSFTTQGYNVPIQGISYEKALEFILKLNQLTGKTYRLPTEAEWEFSARGGNKSKHYMYAGSNDVASVAVYNFWNGYPSEVGTKLPNELGIYDMSGNVWEWCSDWNGEYEFVEKTNPKGPSVGKFHILKGGSFWNHDVVCRISNRYGEKNPDYFSLNNGFRLVLENNNFPISETQRTETIKRTKQQGDEYLSKIQSLIFNNMVKVQGGTFTMGCTSEQGDDCWGGEKPAHQVTLDSYLISKFEVTNDLWQLVMNGFSGDSWNDIAEDWKESDELLLEQLKRPKLPIVASYYEAENFIKKLNSLLGSNYRLPTEAEWEYAARGGNQSKGYKYSGSNNLGDVAWYSDNSDKIHEVGMKQANELGIYDMSGNVWEWCSDWYGDYSSGSLTNPTGAYSGSYRVFRGGYWYSDARLCRVSLRNNDAPVDRCSGIGFRLACSSK